MKKFMFLFLIVAFVAVMAGGAMAKEDCTCGGPTSDTLSVNMQVLPCNVMRITETEISLCAYVPCWDCGDPQICTNDAVFHYDFCASGFDPGRKLTVDITGDYSDANTHLFLKMPSNAEEKMLTWGPSTEIPYGSIPNAQGQEGNLELRVGEDTTQLFDGQVTLTFMITSTSNWGEPCSYTEP